MFGRSAGLTVRFRRLSFLRRSFRYNVHPLGMWRHCCPMRPRNGPPTLNPARCSGCRIGDYGDRRAATALLDPRSSARLQVRPLHRRRGPLSYEDVFCAKTRSTAANTDPDPLGNRTHTHLFVHAPASSRWNMQTQTAPTHVHRMRETFAFERSWILAARRAQTPTPRFSGKARRTYYSLNTRDGFVTSTPQSFVFRTMSVRPKRNSLQIARGLAGRELTEGRRQRAAVTLSLGVLQVDESGANVSRFTRDFSDFFPFTYAITHHEEHRTEARRAHAQQPVDAILTLVAETTEEDTWTDSI